MCLQCMINAKIIYDFKNGLVLQKVETSYEPICDHAPFEQWKADELAITFCNDPDLIFSGITFGYKLRPDEEIDADWGTPEYVLTEDTPEEIAYWEECEKLEQILIKTHYSILYRLFKYFTDYDQDGECGSFNFWLYDKIAAVLEEIK